MSTGVLAARVYRGIALMDEKHGTEWVWKVDPSTLDMRDTCQCVVGQTYGGELIGAEGWSISPYYYGMERLGLSAFGGASVKNGFNVDKFDDDYAPLTRIWAYAITRLRGQRPVVSHG